jgi:hypothetical protein
MSRSTIVPLCGRVALADESVFGRHREFKSTSLRQQVTDVTSENVVSNISRVTSAGLRP